MIPHTPSVFSQVLLTWLWLSRSRWLNYPEIRQKISSSGHWSESVQWSSGKANRHLRALRTATSDKSSLQLAWKGVLSLRLHLLCLFQLIYLANVNRSAPRPLDAFHLWETMLKYQRTCHCGFIHHPNVELTYISKNLLFGVVGGKSWCGLEHGE